MTSARILFLYTELAGYTVACLEKFIEDFPGFEIMLIHFPINKEAPFRFRQYRNFTTFVRNTRDNTALEIEVEKFAPKLILCSGWVDKGYISICKKYSGNARTVLLLDNKWEGSLKQRLASALSPFTFIKYFSHAWVPGEAQKKFALKLGFPQRRIKTGFYSADTDQFLRIGERLAEERKRDMPHRFIFAARYHEFKGLNELLLAFSRLRNETGTDWELWCTGTGSIVPAEIDGVKHFGFVQPEQMEEIMKETSVFILPSKIEPWGVAVHEFACAGFPLLLSDQVGAKESFLINGENGFCFKAGSAGEILVALKNVIALNDDQLRKMGHKSRELASSITTETWAKTLNELLNSPVN